MLRVCDALEPKSSWPAERRRANRSAGQSCKLGLQTMAFHAIVFLDWLRIGFRMEPSRHKRWRSVSASICLLVVVLLYAPLAGAAWSSYQASCCASDQCPIAGHHHQKPPSAPANHMDCGHDMPGMMACSMSCCRDSERSMVSAVAFVLPPSVVVVAPAGSKSPIEPAKVMDFLRSLEPLSPPPRLD